MGTLHFSLGEDLGKRITEIAQEKLLYDCDPNAAIETYTQSLCGFTPELALRCLSGKDLKLVVDGDEMRLTDEDVEGYPTVDFKFFIDKWKQEFKETYKVFERPLREHLNFKRNRDIYVNVNICDILKSYENNDIADPYEFLNEFIVDNCGYDLDEVNGNYIKCVDDIEYYRIFKKWKILNIKRLKTIKFLIDNNFVEDVLFPYTMEAEVVRYSEMVELCLSGRFIEDNDYSPLDSFLAAQREIDATKTLEPISPTEYRNACWVSPEGEIYGMDGEIANMLHITIADILVEQGTITPANKWEENNHYSILEDNGWVKLHDDWIMFEPNVITHGNNKKVFMTDKQQEVIAEYLHNNCGDIGQFGIRHTPISSMIFKQMDKFAINKLFEF